ncbi:MAG: Glycerate 2-kinase [Elusimicrobia bacterium]|nr:Glycerate 2-kinase [Elusimicrobiota bacterium]
MGRSVREQFPKATLIFLPLADGGDGTLDVLTHALDGTKKFTWVEGPLGRKVKASWALIEETKSRPRRAVIEMARASGLALIRGKNRIMEATSYGTGQLIKAALDHDCKEILMGVGGTACSDGGAGALQALGLRYYGHTGRSISAKPKDLQKLDRVDFQGLDPRLRRARIYVLCDVENPLLGTSGSARTFGPQKGATGNQVQILEKMLHHWSRFAPLQAQSLKGAGAAGGMAFGLAGFAKARLVRGTSYVMRALEWEKEAKKADLIVTGEGRLDKTSFQGKVVGEIIKHRVGVPVWVVCGSHTLTPNQLKQFYISKIFTLKEFL